MTTMTTTTILVAHRDADLSITYTPRHNYCPTTHYSLPPLHYHSISIRGDSPSTIHNSHPSSIQSPRTTHYPYPATHGPFPGTHYPLLTGLYLPRLAPLSFIARSQQTFLRHPARRWRPKKIPLLRPAPPSAARPRRERQRQAKRQRKSFFTFIAFFLYFNLKI